MRVEAATPEALSWLEARTGCVLTRHARGLMAVRPDSSVAGVVAFDDWRPASCQAHMAVAHPIAWRCLLPAARAYAFGQAAREVVLGVIPAHNAASLRHAQHVGFTEAGRLRDGWQPGVDLLFLTLRREAAPSEGDGTP